MADDGWSVAELLAAGWTEADIGWERRATAAMTNLAAGNLDQARDDIAMSLRIANGNFAVNDPRTGTSLANHGAALVAAGKAELSGRTLADAVRVWRACDPWVAEMTAPRVARSSLFHMRMEQRHRPAYEARWRVKWGELVEEARAAIGNGTALTLVTADEAAERAARWTREQPAMLNDTRKLMGAVLLLACRTP